MRRLEKNIFDRKGLLLNLEDVVTLLSHKREEAFDGERVVRLFQFRTWILFSDQTEAGYARSAELMTAVKYLDHLEEDHFFDDESARLRNQEEESIGVVLNDKPPQTTQTILTLMRDNKTYRQIFNRLIGRRGGLLALLHAPSLANFDLAIQNRIDHVHIIADLIDYRLRYIQHRAGNKTLNADPNGANHNHAMFFCWWPTSNVPGKRGKTAAKKSVSAKTMGTWWRKLENSALFIYLIQKHGFGKQFPIGSNDDSFIDDLLRSSNDTEELLRFFGAYAYLTEVFTEAQSGLAYVNVPASISRVSISTPPFSEDELQTIGEYEEHYLDMTY